MVRWPEGARARLGDAALDLFTAQGYAGTTVDEVAVAAGVTQRTFFRHFRDKEEVLFGDDEDLLTVLLSGVAQAGGDDPAVDLKLALGVLADFLEPRREHLSRRAAVIATDVGLLGRDLAKQARWTSLIADVLRERGYPPGRADLLAHVGSALVRHVLQGWLSTPGGLTLHERVDRAVSELTVALR